MTISYALVVRQKIIPAILKINQSHLVNLTKIELPN